jgi:uncharacterized protein (DUF433 family)
MLREARPASRRTVMNPLHERISIDPNVCFGKPCVRGTRIWVSLILDLLASGMSKEEIRSDYTSLSHEDILAAIPCGIDPTARVGFLVSWKVT